LRFFCFRSCSAAAHHRLMMPELRILQRSTRPARTALSTRSAASSLIRVRVRMSATKRCRMTPLASALFPVRIHQALRFAPAQPSAEPWTLSGRRTAAQPVREFAWEANSRTTCRRAVPRPGCAFRPIAIALIVPSRSPKITVRDPRPLISPRPSCENCRQGVPEIVRSRKRTRPSEDPRCRSYCSAIARSDASLSYRSMCCRLAEKVSEIDRLALCPARDLRLGSPGDLLPG